MFVGNNVIIGDNCLIYFNVIIYDYIVIGNNVIIYVGIVFGVDVFYYKNRFEKFDKLVSGGNVIIKDDVDLGVFCIIDRGVSVLIIIGEGIKIDN